MKRSNIYFALLVGLLVSTTLFAAAPLYAVDSFYEKAFGGLRNVVNRGFGGGNETLLTENQSDGLFALSLIAVINYILTFVGIIFFFILFYGGWMWMMARGNEEEVSKAKKIVSEVIIGIIVIVLARIFTELIISTIGTAFRE